MRIQTDRFDISQPRDDLPAGEFARVQAGLLAHPLFSEGLDFLFKPDELFNDGHLRLSVSARTLASYLVASAAFQIHNRSMMKRCKWCSLVVFTGPLGCPLRQRRLPPGGAS